MKKKIIAMLTDALAKEMADQKEYESMLDFLQPLEGKRIDKRLESKLPEGWKMKSDVNGMKFVAPSGNSHHISRGNVLSIDEVKREDTPYSQGTYERIKHLSDILNSPSRLDIVVGYFDLLQHHFHEFKRIANLMDDEKVNSFYVPPFYSVLKELGVSYEAWSAAKYGDK